MLMKLFIDGNEYYEIMKFEIFKTVQRFAKLILSEKSSLRWSTTFLAKRGLFCLSPFASQSKSVSNFQSRLARLQRFIRMNYLINPNAIQFEARNIKQM